VVQTERREVAPEVCSGLGGGDGYRDADPFGPSSRRRLGRGGQLAGDPVGDQRCEDDADLPVDDTDLRVAPDRSLESVGGLRRITSLKNCHEVTMGLRAQFVDRCNLPAHSGETTRWLRSTDP
jgi:hypothetical protein